MKRLRVRGSNLDRQPSRAAPSPTPYNVAPRRLIRVDGRHIKVSAWYDDEWGFSNRVVDTLQLLARWNGGGRPSRGGPAAPRW
ncbi:hypothetical protein ACFSBZ_00845 [Amnibacterium flavum]|uniref:Glyceraldehyde 3-phosphate dehydrogenase catalytic domain-containing protein n=1 Tax=Amnibacterium flavum TaxID=2173173 RepID=A0A2V1HTW2_9MICO|nr:hypothetical protein [Amnibacterium flavum]PVZ93534.1 hypothetical protein DDQ50_14540 [Amnibacterium flavum]